MNQAAHHWTKVLPPVLLCAALWGSAFPCIKLVYQDWEARGIETGLAHYWWFAGIRFVLAGLVLLLISKQPLRDLRATPAKLIIAFSLTQTTLQYLFFYIGISLASGSLSSLMVSTGSYWWIILSPILLKTPWPNLRQWLAITVGAIGVSIATSSSGGGEAGGSVAGVLILLAATLMGALGLITFSKLRPTIGPRAATGYSLFFGGLLLLGTGLPAGPDTPELFSPRVILLTLWLATVSASAFTLWNHLSTQHPVNLLAGYRFLIPICGVIESVILIPGESLGKGLVFGSLLVALSLIVAQRTMMRTPPAKP
ncbi:MAG: DMT family transporter [Verrucomicrobiota bacterium JB023]|nr:DMT family transporter [Verrucomicrobiota bacterium JB023]